MFTPNRPYTNASKEDISFFRSLSLYDSYSDGHNCSNSFDDVPVCYHHLYIALCFEHAFLLGRGIPPSGGPRDVKTDIRSMLDSKYNLQFCAYVKRRLNFLPDILDFSLGMAVANESTPIDIVIQILVLTPYQWSRLPFPRLLSSGKLTFKNPYRLSAIKALFTPMQMLVNLRLFCRLLNGDSLKHVKIQ